MQKFFYQCIRVLVVATFAVPLVVLPSSFIFPFIVPKILLFRSLTLLMFGSYVLLLIMNWQKFRPHVTPLTITIGIFFLSFGVSTFAGVDWYHSFWDNHERMLGLFTIIHYFLYYLVLSTVFPTWKDWRPLLYLLLGAGTIVMCIGIAQKIDPRYLLNNGSDRVSATLGNAIYYSGYGLFLFFLGAMLFFMESSKRQLMAYLAAAGSLIGFVGIFLGGTRGTMIGCFVGLLVVCILYAACLKDHVRVRQALFGLICLGLLTVVVLFLNRQSAFVSDLPGVGRLLNTDIAHIGDNTRVMAWSVAIDAWKEKPILGWGPNNFYYAFNKYYRPEFLRYGWGETWFDNAHNIIMNTLATQGVFGLATYLAVFVVGIWSLAAAYRARRIPLPIMVFSIGFLAAHLVHNVFVFENPTSYLYFCFFLAFVTTQTLGPDQAAATGGRSLGSGPVSWPMVILVSSITVLCIFATDINPKRANTATLIAIQKVYMTPESAADAYSEALAIPSPHIDDIRNDMARTVSEVTDSLIAGGKTELAKTLVVMAYDELEKNLELHPLDIRVNIELAQLALRRAELFRDPMYIIRAEQLYTEALEHSTKRQQIQYALVGVKLQLGKNADAVELAETAWNNDRTIAEAWWRLAWVYSVVGQTAKAQALITEAESKGMVFSDQGQQLVASIMASGTKK